MKIRRKLTMLILGLILLVSPASYGAGGPELDQELETLSQEEILKKVYDIGYSLGKKSAEDNKDNNKTYEDVKLTDGQVGQFLPTEVKDLGLVVEAIEEFQKAFKEAYLKYKEDPSKPEEEKPGKIDGHGASLGFLYGEMAGIRDANRGLSYREDRDIISESSIIRDFNLRDFPYEDRYKFVYAFKKAYREGYESGYTNTRFKSLDISISQAKAQGREFGGILGQIQGSLDFYLGEKLDPIKNMPGDREIIERFSLRQDEDIYQDSFVNGFKNSYEEAYKKSYREARDGSIKAESQLASSSGSSVGRERGRIQAGIDHMNGEKRDLREKKDLYSEIIASNGLYAYDETYINDFVASYYKAYNESYLSTYSDLTLSSSLGGKLGQEIPIKGGSLTLGDSAFRIDIGPGTFYRPIYLTVERLPDNYRINPRYILGSDIYRTYGVGPGINIDSKHKIDISFEYYGDQDGAIYMLEGNKWSYLTSKIEDGRISASINPARLRQSGNVFAVLIDKETEIFHDIRGHWAKDEITTYIRRDVILGYPDGSFKPDNHITRGEFLVLLSRLYDWNLPVITDNNKFFKDYESFSYADKYISYGYSMGYIIGYPDRYYRPENNISYKEVDIIMKRVLNDYSFTWESHAQNLMYEKNIRSKSYNDYNNKITRAEFSYLLYQLNQWKY